MLLFSIGAVLAIAAGATSFFLLTDDRAVADLKDWPALTMTYTIEVPVNDITISQTRRLTYTSRHSWIEEVIEADDIETNVGTFNDVGSYQEVENGSYITYDASSGHTPPKPYLKGW